AEDIIRDFHVTGVRTCALPIYALAEDGDSLAEALLRSHVGRRQLLHLYPGVADALEDVREVLAAYHQVVVRHRDRPPHRVAATWFDELARRSERRPNGDGELPGRLAA